MNNPYKIIYELREDIAELSERCREQEADIEELLKERKWISVKDRLPEENTVVLAHYDDGIICAVAYLDKHLKFMSSGNVTHWIPLPDPPKGDNE